MVTLQVAAKAAAIADVFDAANVLNNFLGKKETAALCCKDHPTHGWCWQ